MREAGCWVSTVKHRRDMRVPFLVGLVLTLAAHAKAQVPPRSPMDHPHWPMVLATAAQVSAGSNSSTQVTRLVAMGTPVSRLLIGICTARLPECMGAKQI